MTLLYIILATLAEMLVALTGIFFMFMRSEIFKKYLPYFISFSVGTFLAVVFLNILPEAIEESSAKGALAYTLAGFLFFFALSRFLHWYHYHEQDHHVVSGSVDTAHTHSIEPHQDHTMKTSGWLVLVGDVIHNAIDGVVIALAFVADFNLGVATTIAVLFHELPQEAADFIVLLHSGFSRAKALFFNFLVSSSTLITAVLTYFVALDIDKFMGPALGVVAGNFLYIAAADLIPELHTRHYAGAGSTLKQFSLILLGVFVMYAIILLIPEQSIA